jgi:hypothetical protein
MKKKRKMFAGLKIMSTFATQMRNKLTQSKCPDGGIGRRVGLKHQWIHFHPGSIPGLGTRNPDNIDCQDFLFYRAYKSFNSLIKQ